MAAFNANDLDTVMSVLAEDAEYRPGDGVRSRRHPVRTGEPEAR